MINVGTLTSTGWTDWSTVAGLIGDDPCLWTDLGGLHAGEPLPAQVPAGATHLWSWRPDRWIRVRIDTGRALASVLTCGAGPGTTVTFSKATGIAWGNHERAAECHLSVTLRRTEGPAPVTFVAESETR